MTDTLNYGAVKRQVRAIKDDSKSKGGLQLAFGLSYTDDLSTRLRYDHSGSGSNSCSDGGSDIDSDSGSDRYRKGFDVDADQEESPRAKCLMVRSSSGLMRDGCLSSFAGERAEPKRSERA
jgi:hypothetical protein